MQRYDALWAVHNYSLKWRAMQRRCEVRHAAFEESLAEAIEDDKPAIQACLDALDEAQSFEVCSPNLRPSIGWRDCTLC